MTIYGSAILNQASSTFAVDYNGEEVSKNELYLLAYADLTWKGMDVPEEECNWVVGSKVFHTMKEFQMYLKAQVRVYETYAKEMVLIDNMEIILLDGSTEMMDVYAIKNCLKVKAIGKNHIIKANVPETTEESIKKLEEYKGYNEGFCSDWNDNELKVAFFSAGMSKTLYQMKN